MGVSLSEHDLRGDVLRCAADAEGDLFFGEADFAESEVGEADVSVLVEEYVFGFEVAVDDVTAVEVL